MKELDDTEFLRLLGQRISAIRREQQLTKVQLAFEIGTSESSIRRIEKGQINIGINKLRKIAKALDTSISQLLEF